MMARQAGGNVAQSSLNLPVSLYDHHGLLESNSL